MGYYNEYLDREGKCEYCTRHNTGSGVCGECYGAHFKDSMDLFTFIKTRIVKDADEEFDKSEMGKQLLDRYSHAEDEYLESKHAYEDAKTDFEYSRIDSFYTQMDQLGVKND